MLLQARFPPRQQPQERIRLRNSPYTNEQEQQTQLHEQDGSWEINFVKAKIVELTMENLQSDVLISTEGAEGPLHTLYQFLREVFSPELLQNPKYNTSIEDKTQTLLATLENDLSVAVRKSSTTTGNDTRTSASFESGTVAGVVSPIDEINYWEHLSETVSGRETEYAMNVLEQLKPVLPLFEDAVAGRKALAAVIELIEETQNALDAVWRVGFSPKVKIAYNESRMKHLFSVISNAIVRVIQSSGGCGSLSLWDDDFTNVRLRVRDCIRLCDTWQNVTWELTSRFWPTFESHPWQDETYTDSLMQRFSQRLRDVLKCRATYNELIRLLPSTTLRELRVETVLEPLQKCSNIALLPSVYTQKKWQDAVASFEQLLEPVENKAIEALRARLDEALNRDTKHSQDTDSGSAMKDKPSEVLAEFSRFSYILARNKIGQALTPQREQVLALLTAIMENLDGEFESKCARSHISAPGEGCSASDSRLGSNSAGSSGKFSSNVVNYVIWAQSARSRIREMVSSSKPFLSQLPGWEHFASLAEDLESRCNSWQKQVFHEWSEATQSAIQDGNELSLHLNKKVVEFDKHGNLVVNYTEALVQLLREARQLSELGLKLPKAISDAAKHAQDYFRYGLQLQKVAQFYNTMGTQIIPSQKPMLLEPLVDFEEKVAGATSSSGEPLKWNDPQKCAQFVKQLQTASEKVALANRRLRKSHSTVCREVVGLMQLDILRQKASWKSKLLGIKDYLKKLMQAGQYREEQVISWLRHWDSQLYKAIEIGYKFGLESLNEHLGGSSRGEGSLRAELAFSQAQKCIVFNPSLEELRSQYYSEMRRFISLPDSILSLQGIAREISQDEKTGSRIFSEMRDNNSKSLSQVYRKAEILFARLSKLKEKYEKWIVVGCVKGDIDTLVEENVNSIDDWENNVKSLKSVRKEAERLPDFENVDCVTVSLAKLKSTIEDHLDRLNNSLLWGLRQRLVDQVKAVESFLQNAIEKLNERPNSIDAIAEAQNEWKQIAEKKPEIKELYKHCEAEKQMLFRLTSSESSSSAGRIDLSEVSQRISKIPEDWKNFEIAMEAFHDMIDEQKENLKQKISSDIVEFNRRVKRFAARWEELNPASKLEDDNASKDKILQIFDSLENWKDEVDNFKAEAFALKKHSESFGLQPPTFDELENVKDQVDQLVQQSSIYKQYTDEKDEMMKQDWISFRAHVFDLQDFAAKWLNIVKEKRENIESKGTIAEKILRIISGDADLIRRAVPGLKLARGDAFKEEHWSTVFRKLGISKGVRLESLCVSHFLERPVLEKLTDAEMLKWLKDLNSRAQGEVAIREALQELQAWCETSEFTMTYHESNVNGEKTPIIKDWGDVFAEVGDNQSLVGSLRDSPYFKPFADQAAYYESRFYTLDGCMNTLNSIQRRWVYLEPIFGRGSLPSEAPRFNKVDREFRNIMGKLESDAKVINLADEALFPNLQSTLNSMSDQLDRCMKALSAFLEEKRNKMPRFYFLGDDDLLEILGRAEDPEVIQNHLKKLFQGVHRVNIETQNGQQHITQVISSAGETVSLYRPVAVDSDVTTWLHKLSQEIVFTLRRLLADAVNDGRKESNYLEKYPSQILSLAESIHFTAAIESALKTGNISEVKQQVQRQLDEYTSIDFSSIEGGELMRLKVKSLLLDLVHQMDICDQLLRSKVSDRLDWVWQKQLRYYLVDKSKISTDGLPFPEGKHPAKDAQLCVIFMCDAKLNYTYEYQGNAPKLVYTPLTDKCYLTLTQGIAAGCGGNPYGPAGTGKTESVKALGSALGRQVLVFNCDEGIDFQSMGRIFTGLVKCGAWGCFDEFNRLKADQLSAVSGQIQVIQASIKDGKDHMELLGTQIEVNPHAGIFVTMNPAGKGYGGRSKLPDNLKALFRPVAMSRPDNELIAETLLFAEGFKNAKELGRKIASLFSMASQLLSIQQHYDWGLRAMKTVLNTGGALIRSHSNAKEEDEALTEMNLLVKATRVNTMSKLTYDDSNKFSALLSDVFPGVVNEDIEYVDLANALRKATEDSSINLKVDETQINKIQQLKEALDQRMGCVLVGPSGCGKSTLWKVLSKALEIQGVRVVTHVMNPKSMPRDRLLGWMDPDTREWHDGALTAAARSVVREPQSTRAWIICDGDIDPEWIESLNSVLDDNHLLTLPNGERISFGDNINFLFETHDLTYASPATISRMGMIFLSEDDVDIQRLVEKWLESRPEEVRSAMQTWMEKAFFPALEWLFGHDIRSKGEMGKSDEAVDFVVETTLVGMVKNGLSHVESATTAAMCGLGIIRGLGGNLETQKRSEFSKFVFECIGERPPDPKYPLDCFCDSYGSLQQYQTILPDTYLDLGMTSDSTENVSVPLIETVSVQRVKDTLAPWIDRMEPFALVGPEGSGKTMLIQTIVQEKPGLSMTVLDCNSETHPEHVVGRLKQACGLYTSSRGKVFRPREGDRLVLFLRNINLPKPDKYDTCPLIAFLHQLVTFNGFFDESLQFLRLEKIQIIASLNPSSTVGRYRMSSRFTGAIRIAYMDPPTSDELRTITKTYLGSIQNSQQPSDNSLDDPKSREDLAKVVVSIWEQMRDKHSTSSQHHYRFTPRDITSWISGLSRYDLKSESVVEVLAYECQRIFRDRLSSNKDVSQFDTLLASMLKSTWRVPLDQGFGLPRESSTQDREVFCNLDKSSASGSCLQRLRLADLQGMVERGITLYEREERELRLVLFPEVLENIAAVNRPLACEGGSIVLVGRTGVGRRSITSLVAFMLGMQFRTLSVSRSYGIKSFHSELKSILATAGIDGSDVCFFVEDHVLEQLPSVAQAINSLLSSGEVPGLYTHDELESVLAPLRDTLDTDFSGPAALYGAFVSRVRRHLRICISLDPNHPHFRKTAESNPAFFSRTTTLWMGSWRQDSLSKIPPLLIPSMFSADRTGEVEALLRYMVQIHLSSEEYTAKSSGVTPRDFISFLHAYEGLYEKKVTGIQEELSHLSAGLEKLQEAESHVDELAQEAAEYKEEVSKKQAEADDAMTQITDALQTASSRRHEVKELQEKLSQAEEDILKDKEKIDAELADVQPVLDAAKAAVGQIQSDNLNEIRSFKTPPPPIVDVLSAVLKLLGTRDTSWLSMKKFLGQRGVKDQVLQYDARSMTTSVRAEVEKIVNEKSSSFEPANIQRTSRAAAPLASWVKANIQYSRQLEKVAPLEEKRNRAENELTESRNKLEESEREIAEIDEKVAQLKEDFKVRTSEAEKVRSDLRRTENTLNKAQDLLDKLSGERERWRSTVGRLEESISQLSPRMLLSAAFMTYLGGCDERIRQRAFEKWKQICPIGENVDFKSMLVTESEVLKWKGFGLPTDALSVENAIIILAANRITRRTPYIIDPAGTAVRWLQKTFSGEKTGESEGKESDDTPKASSTNEWTKEKSGSIEIVSASNSKLQNQIELAVRFGKTILITDMDVMEPSLYPILRKDIYNQGSRTMIPVGDKILDFNDGFEVYLATKNPHPNLPPNAAGLLTEANFTVTRSGLEGQLLGVTIGYEKPELEKQKTELLAQEEAYKIQLSDLEKQLIELLASSKGNILENDALIQSLTATKTKAAEIQSALEGSAKASAELDEQRNVYRPFASAGGDLYFLITDIRAHNHMYQFSLETFIEWFKNTLEESSGEQEITSHIVHLIPALEKRVVTSVGRSIFKGDRLMFALHVVHGVRKDLFGPKEWEFFVGELVPDVSDKKHSEFPVWGPPDRHSLFGLFVNTFPQLYSQVQLHDSSWERWSKSPNAEVDFPSHVSNLSKFQKVLIIQVLRPDRLVSAMANFVCDALDLETVDPPPSSFRWLTEESSAKPVLMITTPGADPSADLKEFACTEIGEENYFEVAMGGGQQDAALQAVREGASKGHWVCLKNLHLVMDWLPILTNEVATLCKSANTHSQFRLWLTTEAHDAFPPMLLQDSLKVTYEAPPGLKKNIKRTYDAWPTTLVESGSEVRAQLLFLLAWLHGILQERRTYVPQGWTKAYEFSFADLRAAVQTLDAMLRTFAKNGNPQDVSEVPWTFLHGLIENAIYGGRIDNGYDARVIRCYLKIWFQNGVLSERCGGEGKPLTRGIVLPHSNRISDFMPIVENLPEHDDPSIFLLPANIEKSVQRATSLSILSGLQSMHTAAHVDEGFDKKVWEEKLSPIIELWEQLANVVDIREVRKAKKLKQREVDALSPVVDFVRLESELSIRLRNIVEKDIEALKQLLYGTASLTSGIQQLGKALLTDQVPSRWMKEWEGPDGPRPWLRALMIRQQALTTEWIPPSIEGTILNQKLDLGTLYRPQAFLNALRQTTARIARVSTDSLKLLAAFDGNRLKADKAFNLPAITLQGLLLQGASLNEEKEVLEEVRADAAEVQPLPPLHVKWSPKENAEPYDSKEACLTPLYASLNREQLLIKFALPVPRGRQTKFVLAGTAMILQTS